MLSLFRDGTLLGVIVIGHVVRGHEVLVYESGNTAWLSTGVSVCTLSSAGAKCGGTTSPCTSSSTGATSGGMASRVRPWARRPRVRR